VATVRYVILVSFGVGYCTFLSYIPLPLQCRWNYGMNSDTCLYKSTVL